MLAYVFSCFVIQGRFNIFSLILNWYFHFFLFQYQYTQQPQCQQLQELVRIVLNTLDSQHHHCRRIPATVVMGGPPSRSRGTWTIFLFFLLTNLIPDVSQPSLGTDNEQLDRINTPPLSPMFSGDGQSGHVSVNTKGGKIQVVYQKPSAAMETHWEETVLCSSKDKKSNRKIADTRY